MTHLFSHHVVSATNKYWVLRSLESGVHLLSAGFEFLMRGSRETDPILPTSNMAATNGKSKEGKKKVLVVGAGAAGM